MKLSVVIVNYNVKYYLEQCLLSVFAALKNMKAEVFVVDNNSSDGSLEYLQPKFTEVIFIKNDHNPGFSKANNQAIRLSTGEFILLLNPDTVIAEDTLENVCHFMETHSDAGGLGVKMIDGNGMFLPESKRGFPSPWDSFCRMSKLAQLFPKSPFFAKYYMKYLDEDETHQIDVLAGAFMLLRRTVLDQTGLLDEAFFMYGEDIDLSYRITQAGYKNYYLPEKIIHYKGESSITNPQYVDIFYDAMSIFFKKHYSHHSKLYSSFVHAGIFLIRKLSKLRRLLFGSKKRSKNQNLNKEHGQKALEQKNSGQQKFREKSIIFNTHEKTYTEIIRLLAASKDKTKLFWIYHPENEVSISYYTVLTGKNITDYGFTGK